jgi:TRAP-type uncharacterized transport system substrate-binding protein
MHVLSKSLSLNILGAASILALVASTHPSKSQEAPNPDILRIGTGGAAGNYKWAGDEIGGRLAPEFKSVEVKTSDGAKANMSDLMEGKIDMGFAQSDVAALYRLENPASLSVLYPFKAIYTEYVHFLCPRATGWTKLSDIAAARKSGIPVKMIVGGNGSGNSETWRAFFQQNPEAYEKIERLTDTVDLAAVSKVKDSKDTCLLWVSGLNSPSMASANAMSTNTRDRKPSLQLLDVDDDKIKSIKDTDGQAIYDFEKVAAKQPEKGKAGMYNNLIADKSSWYSSADNSINVPTVKAVLMTTAAYRQAIKAKTGRIIQTIEDATPTIWNKVNPTN